MTKHQPQLSFKNCGIHPKILNHLKTIFQIPTPIQHQVILQANEGKGIVEIAQTGTGKTLAFTLPMIQALRDNSFQGLVLVPTRELAIQCEEVVYKIRKSKKIKTALIIGGADAQRQIQNLKRNPHVIIATPGRFSDLLEQKRINIKNIRFVVLDEEDRMLDIGFLPQIKHILSQIPKERQTLLFSATMPSCIAEMANQFMKHPLRIEIAPAGSAAKKVEQSVFFIEKNQQEELLQEHTNKILIFTRTKFRAKKLT